MKNSLIFLLLFTASACSSGEKADPQLEQAAAVHEEAMKIEEEARGKLDSLLQLKNSINVQGRALTEAEQAFVREINGLEGRFQAWAESLIEVPGYEHDHDHEHGHDHHHHGKKAPEVTPGHMLNIQQEFRDSIAVLRQEAERLLAEQEF
ncbi:MAG: hypothetical protein H6558_21625 [Lewinellaceae bacterium]|nr:hypothetical protein [Lewinellaceae bacterium]MCB9295709.1 hypothetical protein [Lewinellaceae bacterium]